MSLSTTEHAAAIRATLKKDHKLTSRQVSVRADSYSGGSAIRVRINDPDVSLKLVKTIAEKAESIRRDHFGEILSGGNRYVTVSYSHEALETIASRWVRPVQVAYDELSQASSNVLIPIAGTPLMLGRTDHRLSVWGERYITDCYDVQSVASTVGCHMNDVGKG